MKKEILTKQEKGTRRSNDGPLAGLPAPFEDLVLLTIAYYPGDISGPVLQGILTDAIGKSIDNGAFYGTIRRLESRRWITSRQGDARTEATKKARRYLKLTAAGRGALQGVLDIRKRIIKTCEDIALEEVRGQ